MSDNLDPFVSGANKQLHENLDRSVPAILGSYGLIGSIIAFGTAGYLIDRWLATFPWFLLIGLCAGLIVAFVVLIGFERRT